MERHQKIKECTTQLIDAILESDDYIHFMEARDRLKKVPDLYREVNDFRNYVFTVQNPEGPIDSYEEMVKINEKMLEFRKNPLVDDFLKSELRVCRIVQRISMKVVDAIDLDTAEITERMTL